MSLIFTNKELHLNNVQNQFKNLKNKIKHKCKKIKQNKIVQNQKYKFYIRLFYKIFQYQKLYRNHKKIKKSILFFMSQNTTNKNNTQYTRKKIQQFSYGLNDVIGKGYSSQVYKGRHDQTQQPVAVKVIDMKMLKNEINRTLLESQIEILKQLKQVPNVLTLHQVYTTKNNTYIITELCSSDLNKKIKSKMNEDEVFYFMDQILQGYMQVYQKQIVHRDLKPANILLTQRDQCKIADFGFAIKASQLLKPSKYNVGSPLYMAPESLKKNQYSYKTDLWSVGVIFFEMLTGETPWKAKTQKQLLKKIQTQRIETVIDKRKLNFSTLTVDFLSKCLCIEKHKRLQPYQLKKYSFRPNVSNILMQTKSINLQNQNPEKFNNNSNTKQNTGLNITSPKNQLFTAKFNFPSTNNKTPLSKNIQNLSFNTTTKLNSTIETSTNFGEPSNRPEVLKRDTVKMISKQLISEIHFCRYLFKLLGRIRQSGQKGILRSFSYETNELQKKFTLYIKHKIQKLISFESANFLDFDEKTYKQYKQTSDFKKILKISKEYKDRYKTQLNEHWNLYFDKKFSSEQTLTLMKKMIAAFEVEQNNVQKDIEKYSKDVIILDYLITAKQLLEMLSQGQNYQKFSRKSKIQQIVQGTTTTITYDLYEKIMQRGRQLTSHSSHTPKNHNTNFYSYNTRDIPMKV